jgi:hypothetical protein
LENLWTLDEVDKSVIYGENFTSLLLLPQKYPAEDLQGKVDKAQL